MKDIDVVIFYEHVARELDVACAIKATAEQCHGLRVEFEHWPSGLSRGLRRFRPKVVVMPGAFTMEIWDVVLYDWRKAVFLNLTWEQLLSGGTVKRKIPGDEFVLKHVMHHAWSDDWRRFLISVGVPEQNIFVNGNPAYMLYHAPYNRFFKSRSELAREYDLDEGKRWIFFPENFGWAFVPDHQVETDWLSRGVSRKEADTMRQLARQTLEETMKWCASISRDHDVELIVRPRPAVPLDDFRDMAQQMMGAVPHRLRFIKAESIREWIMASDSVISFYSTSLIEAALAGKTCCMLAPYPIPAYLGVEWHNHIDHVSSEEELRNICLHSSSLGDGSRLADWARRGMLDRGDPIRNIADHLAAICRGEVRTPSALPRRLIVEAENGNVSALPGLRRLLRSGMERLPWLLFEYRKIRYRESRRNAPGLILKVHENDHLSEDELRQRAERWKRCLGRAGGESLPEAVRLKQGRGLAERMAPVGSGSSLHHGEKEDIGSR